MLAAVKAWFAKSWLYIVLALLVLAAVLFALLRWEHGKRLVAEAIARNAEVRAAIKDQRHKAATNETAARRAEDERLREREAELSKEREQLAGERKEAAAEHAAEVEEIDAAAGDDDKVHDALANALKRDDP